MEIGEESSIWYGVVIRGDVNKIRLGKRVNIQDLSMVHGTVGRGDTLLGDNVSVGHRAIIHGCQIESDVLIGMGAIVLDDVLVPSQTIIAAGAVVTSGTVLEGGTYLCRYPRPQDERTGCRQGTSLYPRHRRRLCGIQGILPLTQRLTSDSNRKKG